MREPQEREKKAFALIFFSIRKWKKTSNFFFFACSLCFTFHSFSNQPPTPKHRSNHGASFSSEQRPAEALRDPSWRRQTMIQRCPSTLDRKSNHGSAGDFQIRGWGARRQRERQQQQQPPCLSLSLPLAPPRCVSRRPSSSPALAPNAKIRSH